MDFSKVTAITIPEGNVVKIENGQSNVVWSTDLDPNKSAYGIRWDNTVPDDQATTACERIGNLELHKTLPIQSRFATCIHQGTDIKYWCDPNDSRFRKDNTGFVIKDSAITITQLTGKQSQVIPSDYSPNNTYHATIQFGDTTIDKYNEAKLAVTTYKYLYAFIKVNDVICRINKIDFTNKLLYITVISGDLNFKADTITLEFGCSINGYDGEISVYTPKFYIWSVDNNGAGNEVWISLLKCVDYAREVKAHLISINRFTLLKSAMNDDKWGWLNTLSDHTGVSVANYQPNLRGGQNRTAYDKFLSDNNFRSQLGKGVEELSIDHVRKCTQKIKDCKPLYYQIWSAIIWCYFIEYADFNVKKAFNSNLTDEGYHQGGLGNNCIDINFRATYNAYAPTAPVDYTLSIGNNTGIITKPSHYFYQKTKDNTTWKNWNVSRVTTTIDDNNNNVLNITQIPKLYNDWMLQAYYYIVGGTHKYKIENLSENQTIIFKTQSGDVVISEDGEYDINWGTEWGSKYNRCIKFSKIQEQCNIKITILKSPAFNYAITQCQLDIPCYRGFCGFWYSDTYVNIDNLMSQYDTISKKRKFYSTNDISNFSNDIVNDKNIIMELDLNGAGWIKNISIGKTAGLIPNKLSKNSNYTNCYEFDFNYNNIHTTHVGGGVNATIGCGLATMGFDSRNPNEDVSFVKCYILN